MKISSNIRTLRQRKGMTQEQIAAHLGVSYQVVSKWETGANTPDILLLPDLAVLFAGTFMIAIGCRQTISNLPERFMRLT